MHIGRKLGQNYSSLSDLLVPVEGADEVNFVIKLLRAYGGCLGAKRR